MNRTFLYFPSFGAGDIAAEMGKNFKLKNGLPVNFCSNEFPLDFQHPYFLISAGHYYNSKSGTERLVSALRSNVETKIFGDSGGHQLAVGTIKWSDKLPQIILNWLEENTDIAANLDVPPLAKNATKFNECLEKSFENFKYFNEHRTGKNDLLNVVQGRCIYSCGEWYNKMKYFDFDGWAFGGGGESVYRFLSGITTLIEGRECYNINNKYIHIFGTSKILDFLMLSQLQKSLNDINSHIQIITDSSSPNISGFRYGLYYYDFNLDTKQFKSFHIPKEHSTANTNKLRSLNDNMLDSDNNLLLPNIIEFDKYLKGAFNLEDIKDWTHNVSLAIVLHNLMFFNRTIDIINSFVYGHSYFLKQVCNDDTLKILTIMDEIIKSYENGTTPVTTFLKYEAFLKKYDKKYQSDNSAILKDEFFQFQ